MSEINWISTKDKPLPKDERTYLVIWKGAFGLAQYNADECHKCFYLSFMPAEYDVMRVSHDREHKFTHWCELTYPSELLTPFQAKDASIRQGIEDARAGRIGPGPDIDKED